VEEPATCEYLMSISCPQACGWDAHVPASTPLQSEESSTQVEAAVAASDAAVSVAPAATDDSRATPGGQPALS
jgi:hypothetical protein